jgi:hypothetical protein
MTASLADLAGDRLAQLGPDPATIADRLHAAGIRGRRYNARCCPISNYLSAQTGLTRVDTGGGRIYIGAGSCLITLTTPLPVALFVRAFDKGAYPDLVAADQGWQADIEGGVRPAGYRLPEGAYPDDTAGGDAR